MDFTFFNGLLKDRDRDFMWLVKPEVFSTWPSEEKVCWPLFYTMEINKSFNLCAEGKKKHG